VEYDVEVKLSKSPAKLLERLVNTLYRKFKMPVVVLIYEYSKPILDHIGEGACPAQTTA